MAYSMDLRQRVVAAVEAGGSIAAVARRFSVARPTVRDWRDRARRGALSAGTPGPKGSIKLTEADDQWIRQQVAAQPGITARQLLEGLRVAVSLMTVYRHLKRLGLSLKRSR